MKEDWRFLQKISFPKWIPRSAMSSTTPILTLHWPSLVMFVRVAISYDVNRSWPTTLAILVKPCTTLSLTSELSSFKSSIRIGKTFYTVYSLPMIDAISHKLYAAPALNWADESAYESYKVLSISVQIFSVDKFLRHADMF